MSGLVAAIFGESDDMPVQPVENVKQTAAAKPQLSEEAKRKRRRDAAMLNQGMAPPTLGVPGLLGLGQGK